MKIKDSIKFLCEVIGDKKFVSDYFKNASENVDCSTTDCFGGCDECRIMQVFTKELLRKLHLMTEEFINKNEGA